MRVRVSALSVLFCLDPVLGGLKGQPRDQTLEGHVAPCGSTHRNRGRCLGVSVTRCDYGWPFIVATTDRFQAPIGSEWIVGDVAFWLVAPQILVYLYARFGAPTEYGGFVGR